MKRSHGEFERARLWFREFREIALMCVVYNIKLRQTVNLHALQRFNIVSETQHRSNAILLAKILFDKARLYSVGLCCYKKERMNICNYI
jgi:hypothetical protein